MQQQYCYTLPFNGKETEVEITDFMDESFDTDVQDLGVFKITLAVNIRGSDDVVGYIALSDNDNIIHLILSGETDKCEQRYIEALYRKALRLHTEAVYCCPHCLSKDISQKEA